MHETLSQQDPNFALLQTALSASVPLYIDRLKRLPFSDLQARAKICSQIVAEKGDNILFRSKKPGATADAFNALAEGIACCAFSSGGVTVFGLHFEVELTSKLETGPPPGP